MLPQGLSSFFAFFIQFLSLAFNIYFTDLSLALSTLPCLHLCPFISINLPLSMALFKHSHFLCCSIPYFGVSTISPKNSSSFNLFSTSPITFIKYRNRHQIKNNIRYGNIDNTSVTIFFKSKSQKLSAMVLCLGEPPMRFL